MAIIQIIGMLIQIAVAEAIKRDQIGKGAHDAPHYVECPRGKYPLIGFENLKDARIYAISSTTSDALHWRDTSGDNIAKIFEKGGKHIETYIGGIPESKYEGVEEIQEVMKKDARNILLEQDSAIARGSYPYYVEHSLNDHIVSSPTHLGFISLERATKFAVDYTIGLYKMNGQLGNKIIKVFERGGRLIETYIGGFPEAEYNRIKTERESKEERKEVKVVTSFGWDPSNMR